MTGRAVAKYFVQVRKFLFCSRSDKKRLAEKCRSFLEGYQQENPEAGYDDIVANFGPPADFAGALMAEMYPDGAQEVRERYINRQKLWLRLAVCAGVVVSALLIGFILWTVFFAPSQAIKTITIQ